MSPEYSSLVDLVDEYLLDEVEEMDVDPIEIPELVGYFTED